MKFRYILILLAVFVVLGLVFFRFGRPEPAPAKAPQDFIWLIDMNSITRIQIALPRQNASQKFIKISQGDQFPWFFDNAQRSPVDEERWSSGIPLLLSGPQADRKILDNASPADLATFGLANPSMVITLGLSSGPDMTIIFGDKTPEGQRAYVEAPNSHIVATVDGSWYDIMTGIVTNPPYAPAK